MDLSTYTWTDLVTLLKTKRVRIMLKAEGAPSTHAAIVLFNERYAPGYTSHGFFMSADGSNIDFNTELENIHELKYVNTIPTDLMYALGAMHRRLSMFKAGDIQFSTLLLNSGGVVSSYLVDNKPSD